MADLIKKEKLISDLYKLGIKNGDLLHIKVSMRAVGKIDGGAKTLLEAILFVLGTDGTLVSDAFVKAFSVPFSPQDATNLSDNNTASYAGAFANQMLKHPQNIRSKHPIHKFVAIGKLAKKLCNNHTELSGGYDLLEVMAELDAKNLTIGGQVVGVGTTHIAIEKIPYNRKIKKKGRNYINEKGVKTLGLIDWNGGCGTGIRKFIPFYKNGAIINKDYIGNASSILTSMKKTLQIEIDILQNDPKFLFCENQSCHTCRISWEHSDKKYIKYYFYALLNYPKKLSIKRFIKKRFKTEKSGKLFL